MKEAVVAVAPCYVKCGKMCYTSCLLFFSRKTIRLKELLLCDRKITYFLEWSTFDIIKIESQQLESVKAEVVCLNMKRRAAIIKTEGESESAKMISDATAAAEMGLIELRKIEAAKENATSMSRNGNVVYLLNNNMILGLNAGR